MAAGQFPGPGTSREWSPRIAVGAILRVADNPDGGARQAGRLKNSFCWIAKRKGGSVVLKAKCLVQLVGGFGHFGSDLCCTQ